MTINRRDVLLGAAGLPFGGAMANDYMSDDPWLDSGGEHDSQQVNLNSLMRRIVRAEQEMRRLRMLMADHGILDSNSDAQSPHPNLNVLAMNAGKSRIDEVGVQFVADGTTLPLPGIFWDSEYTKVGEDPLLNVGMYINGYASPGVAFGEIGSKLSSAAITRTNSIDTVGAQTLISDAITHDGSLAGGAALIATASAIRFAVDAQVSFTPVSVTIAAGVVTISNSSYLVVDTQSAAATDDLDTISGGSTGVVLIVRAANSARTVVAKDGTGNLKLAGDFSMLDASDTLMLIYDGSNWLELSRSTNS